MRKNVLFLSVVALMATLLISSCGKEDKGFDCPGTAEEREALYTGSYTGDATLNIKVLGSETSVPVPAKFTVKSGDEAGDDKLIITSDVLEDYNWGIDADINSGSCEKVTINKITKEELEFTNLPATLAGSLITDYQPLKIIGFEADGTGELQKDGKSLKIKLNILKGKTTSPNSILNDLDVAGNSLDLVVTKK